MTAPFWYGLEVGSHRTVIGRAILRAAAQGRAAKIVIAGHSHVAGAGSGTGTFGLTGGASAGFVGLLPGKLASQGVIADRQYFGDGNVAAITAGGMTAAQWDSRLTMGAGWASENGPQIFGAAFLRNTGNTTKLSFTPGYVFSSARIWYPINTGLGSGMQISVDDVVVQTFSQTGMAGLAFTDVVATGSKLSINRGTGNLYHIGFECIRASAKARILAGGWSGGRISNIRVATDPWNYYPTLGALDADVGILYCMTNDIVASLAAATWKTSAKEVIQRFQETGDAIIVIDPPGQTFNSTLYQQYADAAYAIQAETGCAVLDLRALFVSYANSVAQGWQYDTVHPNGIGHDKIATALAAL